MDDNSRSVVIFTGISHAIVHTYELSIPILVTIWLVEFPVSTATLGAVVSVGYALFGIGALPGGVLADRFGSQILIVACLLGMGISFLVLSFAGGILSVAVALAIWGVAASVYHPSGLSLISTGVENRGTAFAYHGMAGNIGIAFGPLITALLLITFEWRTVTRLLMIPTAMALGYALYTDFDAKAAVSADGGTEQSKSMSLEEFLRDSRALFGIGFALALAIVMMNGLFYRGMLTFLPEVLDQFLPPMSDFIQLFEPGSPVSEEFTLSSYVYVGLLTIGIGGQYIGGKVSDRIAPTTGLAVVFSGLIIVTISFVPAARWGLFALVCVSALFGFFLFALQPLYQATIADHSPSDDRGLSYGYTYLTSFGIGAAGAAISGYLLSVISVDRAFLALVLFPVLGGLFAIALRQRS